MSILTSLTSLISSLARRKKTHREAVARLQFESLENRCLLTSFFVTDLGPFVPNAINNLGQIAGVAPGPSGLDEGAFWQNGIATGLGWGTHPTAINDVGQIAGWHLVPDPNNSGLYRHHAFVLTPEDTNLDGTPDRWNRDTNLDGINDLLVDLGVLPGGLDSYARGINNAGIVVGDGYNDGPYPYHAWIWQDGVMTDLGIPTQAFASAINDRGQVVGYGLSSQFLINPEDTDGDGSPDLWVRDTNGDGANDLAVAIPVGVDINTRGQVVGGNLLWTPDVPNGTTGSVNVLNPDAPTDAVVLNDLGQVFGSMGDGTVLFLWENGEVFPLDSLTKDYLYLIWQNEINANDHGWIAVAGDRYDGSAGGILLTPSDQPPPPPPPPSVTIGDVAVTEGNSGTRPATFTVTLSATSDQPVTVAYATSDAIATAGSDYEAAGGTLTFAPGETSKTITALVNGDRLGESNEKFVVNLSAPTNAIIADGQGVGTILDDEPSISISDVTKYEGKKGKKNLFTFTVTLSVPYDEPVTMSYRTADGTATTTDGDYVARTGMLTFALGETTKTITVEVKGDNKKETTETFNLDLFDLSSNALFTKYRGLGTILNDD